MRFNVSYLYTDDRHAVYILHWQRYSHVNFVGSGKLCPRLFKLGKEMGEHIWAWKTRLLLVNVLGEQMCLNKKTFNQSYISVRGLYD